MEEIINFIQNNYLLLIAIGSGALEFILLFIFKRDKVVDNSITYRLIDSIKRAETRFGSGHGKDKLDYVVKDFQSIAPGIQRDTIKYFVEEILSTPEKKK